MKQPVVCFRDGAMTQVAKILDRLSARKLFFVVDEPAYTASGADKCLEPCLQSRSVTRFSNFELNPKLHDIERGIRLMRETNPDVIVALGGGTAIDSGKLVGTLAYQDGSAREIIIGRDCIQQTSPPLIAIPTPRVLAVKRLISRGLRRSRKVLGCPSVLKSHTTIPMPCLLQRHDSRTSFPAHSTATILKGRGTQAPTPSTVQFRSFPNARTLRHYPSRNPAITVT